MGTRGGRGASAAPAWFGAVGALVGAFGAGVHLAAEPVLGRGLAAALAVAAIGGLTGGLHHDGLADCADAIGVRGGRDRRLAVMREPTIGTYGALALILSILLPAASLAALSPRDAAWALVCAASAVRFAALLHARSTTPARRDGLGAAFAPSWPAVLISGATATAIAVAAFGVRAAAVVIPAVLTAALVSAWARRLLGGRSGDTLGAAVVLTDLAVLVVLVGTAQGS